MTNPTSRTATRAIRDTARPDLLPMAAGSPDITAAAILHGPEAMPHAPKAILRGPKAMPHAPEAATHVRAAATATVPLPQAAAAVPPPPCVQAAPAAAGKPPARDVPVPPAAATARGTAQETADKGGANPTCPPASLP